MSTQAAANTAPDAISIRPLARLDLDAVVAIDAAIERRPRRDYFERRLRAALNEPSLHAQFAASDAHGLAGYILARVLEGEFGESERALRLEVVGARTDLQGHGVGSRLIDALAAWGRRHGITRIRTVAAWNDHRMLAWLDRQGFALARNHVVDCAVHGGAYAPARDDVVSLPVGAGPAQEVAYDGGEGNDFERLARDNADVRAMRPEDLADIVRIDRDITGRNREDYVRHKLNETMVDSAIRVSLTASVDGIVAGYLMARVDLGDFGRTEPTAIIDTIGVDPDYAHRGIGHALLSQLFVNLGGLRVERVETIVAPRDLALLGFLYDVGFAPAQRLAFTVDID
jgi:ribosomal protein S18 acetylase RimI-like enzyme